MSAPSSDTTRLLRACALRLLALALVLGLTGPPLLTLVCLLTGLGLLAAAAGTAQRP